MRPISHDLVPGYLPLPRRPHTAREVETASRRIVPRLDEPMGTDVELSIRVFADGGSISVRRRLAPGPDGTMRTVGIEALIR